MKIPVVWTVMVPYCLVKIHPCFAEISCLSLQGISASPSIVKVMAAGSSDTLLNL